MRYLPFTLALLIGFTVACHPGPVVETTPTASAGGTIAGMASTAS